MTKEIIIRPANDDDHTFIFSLSPHLAEVAELAWHDDAVIQKMQDDYIAKMLAETPQPCATFIAQSRDIPLGFVHVRTHNDGISNEISATIPLLAVSPSAQGLGVGKILMNCAEQWAKEHDCRLLHLEVFANNKKANGFYQALGFKPELVTMIKTL